MKPSHILFATALILLLSLPAVSFAQELPYKDGSVWSLGFVKTRPGMKNDYVKNLAEGWRKVNEEAKKQGLILSYKILSGSSANSDDWDMLLMVEYKNMAALDGMDEKMEAIMSKMAGSEDQRKAGIVKRNEIRDFFGSKIVREIIVK